MVIIVGKHKQIVQRKKSLARPLKAPRMLSLRSFYGKRNKILIIRSVGGLGDIFMHRMMFEDFKYLIGDGELHFACPSMYHPAITDHPYVDRIVDSMTVNHLDYLISYNTTTACGRYEMQMSPQSGLHRSDIWAEHCGVKLTNHNMHIHLTEVEKQEGRDILESYRDRSGPTVVLNPVSAMANKNLLDDQIMAVVQEVRSRGCCVYGMHHMVLPILRKRGVPSIHSLTIRQWMSVLAVADYVISVDTAAFHCSGGMGRPLMGIFTFADGHVYGRYFDHVMVQKHRANHPDWQCGPCYNWGECTRTKNNPKPCLTEITAEMLYEGIDKMFNKWPISSRNM